MAGIGAAASLRCSAIALLFAALAAPVSAAPAALATDPPVDASTPAAMDAVRIPSGDSLLNGIVYTPAGTGMHPALILFHGQPGNEQNLDLAQAARRAGYVVLTLHYRGSWGGSGIFSYANVTGDGINAAEWLIAPEQLARYHIDKDRLVLAGHSVGGFVAMRTAAALPFVKALMLVDAWNPNEKLVADLRASGGRDRYIARQKDGLNMLATTPAKLADELLAAGASMDLRLKAKALATRPVLIIAAQKANGVSNADIAASITASGNKQVDLIMMPTDHGFNDHRIALISASLDWLDQFTAPD